MGKTRAGILLPGALEHELKDLPETARALVNLFKYWQPIPYTPVEWSTAEYAFPGDQWGYIQKMGVFAAWTAHFPTGYTVGAGTGDLGWHPPGTGRVFLVTFRYPKTGTSSPVENLEYTPKLWDSSVYMEDPTTFTDYSAGDPITIFGISALAGYQE